MSLEMPKNEKVVMNNNHRLNRLDHGNKLSYATIPRINSNVEKSVK